MKFWSDCRCGATPVRQARAGCRAIWTNTPVKRPDLAIYSQAEALQNGEAPSWDNPDIITNAWGPFRLHDQASVKVHNLSPSVPAINALVHYSVSPFGIGMPRTPKLTKVVNLPPASEIELSFPLDRATLDGDPRVGVYIDIEHPHDANRVNNRGAQVHDGAYTSESGRDFTVQIPVLNDAGFSREIRLSVMPTDVLATVSPAAHTFGPHEQVVAALRVQVPSFLAGTPQANVHRAVTVVGRLATGELVGGVTRLIRIDD